jgi:hypothetical protein
MAGPHVGVALQQQVGQHWQLLGFFSKKLSKTEVNYSTFDRELLAAVSGIKHFCSWLEGHPFQLWTNHKPLIFALNRVSPPTSGRQQRHLAFISEYTNQLEYIPGTANVVADELSRLAVAATGTAWVCAAIADMSPLNLKDMALRQILCPQVQALRSSPGLCIITQKVGNLLISDSSTAPSAHWCPETFGDRFSNISTEPPTLAGERPAASFPPGMCGKVSPRMSPPGRRLAWAASGLRVHRNVQVPPQHIPVPTRRFSHIHVDLVGPRLASKGFTYLFTIIDRISHWPEAITFADTTTVDCANALFQGWVSRFGVPAVITSDSGAQFTSSLWAALCSLLNIQHNQTTAYHPQSNGMVEHFHCGLKDALRAR